MLTFLRLLKMDLRLFNAIEGLIFRLMNLRLFKDLWEPSDEGGGAGERAHPSVSFVLRKSKQGSSMCIWKQRLGGGGSTLLD